MKVLVLSPHPELLAPAFHKTGDEIIATTGMPARWPRQVDFIVAYNYRAIIKEPYLSEYKNRMVNIHIAMLPWNRGADPNFWSWFDDTPKGASIHLIDQGIDTGGIIAQEEAARWLKDELLRSSWIYLMTIARELFAREWPRIRAGNYSLITPTEKGSYHKLADKDPWMLLLPKKWNTPVSEIRTLGQQHRQATDPTL